MTLSTLSEKKPTKIIFNIDDDQDCPVTNYYLTIQFENGSVTGLVNLDGLLIDGIGHFVVTDDIDYDWFNDIWEDGLLPE